MNRGRGEKGVCIVFFTAFCLITVLTTQIEIAYGSETTGWSMFRHDDRRTGSTTDLGPTTNNLRWSFTTGGIVTSSPAVVNGVVYVGSGDGNIYALDVLTGTKIWNYTTGGVVYSSPAVANDIVFVGSNDTNVYALDGATGAKIWNYSTWWGVWSSPAIVDGVVYVGGMDGLMYALNASTGTLKWATWLGVSMSSSPAVVNGVVYIGGIAGNNEGNLTAIHANNGTIKWVFTPDLGIYFSSPAVADDVVYVGSYDMHVYAVYTENGTQKWKYKTAGYANSSPAVSGGVVYIGSGVFVYAINATTGTTLWSYRRATSGGFYCSAAVATGNGIVYTGAEDKTVYALDATTKDVVWSYTTGGVLRGSAVVCRHVTYVGSHDYKLYAFGPIVGDVDADGNVGSSDLSSLSTAYGSTPGDTNWYSDCDFTVDDKVDVYELFNMAKNYD